MRTSAHTPPDISSACWAVVFVIGILGLSFIGFSSRLVPDDAAKSVFLNEDLYSSTAPR